MKKKEISDSPALDKFLRSFSPGGITEETATHFVSRSSKNKKNVKFKLQHQLLKSKREVIHQLLATSATSGERRRKKFTLLAS